MSEDQKALDLLSELESRKYKHPSQKKAALQCLIIDILKEGDELRSKAAAFDWLESREFISIRKIFDLDGLTQSQIKVAQNRFIERESLLEAVNKARSES